MNPIIILGYDLRQAVGLQLLSWTDERRSRYLVRPEVQTPLSVDRDVWPAIDLSPLRSEPIYPFDLWGSISRILALLPETVRPDGDSSVLIEVAVIPADEGSLEYWKRMMEGRLEPDLDSDLELVVGFLGYDVADLYALSGLSNCMLSADELAVIKAEFSQHINRLGLFEEMDPATRFRLTCDGLVPEHAPFEIYRIRRVQLAT